MKLVTTAVLLGALALTGCTAQSAPAPTVATPEVTAAETCEQYGNVLTVLFNASISLSEGRSIQQEFDGARALAHSMLEHMVVEPATDLEVIVTRLRAIDQADLPNMATDNGSAEWADADKEFGDACRDAGSDVGIMAWTGG